MGIVVVVVYRACVVWSVMGQAALDELPASPALSIHQFKVHTTIEIESRSGWSKSCRFMPLNVMYRRTLDECVHLTTIEYYHRNHYANV